MEQDSVQKEGNAGVSFSNTKINKMVMEGFKSFGKYTELYFGDNFSCVLGPNGSGKSNVLDALCFVLGRSSSKSLRAEKSANLIYNGGRHGKPANKAKVSIFLDNKNKLFPIEGDEVKISRIVNKKGFSKYRINDSTRTRQEVLEFLSSAKIYPDGYNITMQGDIIRFVEMSPIDRRLIIEDIAGISVYEDKKKKALRDLEVVEKKIEEAEIVLKERQSYLKDLKKERDQALKYRELSEGVRKNKATFLKKQILNREEKDSKIKERITDKKQMLEKLQNRIKTYRYEIAEKKSRIKELSEEIESKSEIEQSSLQKEIQGLRVDLATSKTRVSTRIQELERIEKRMLDSRKNLEEIDLRSEELSKKKKEFIESKEKLEKDISRIEKRVEEFNRKKGLHESVALEKELADIDENVENLQSEINKLSEEQQQYLRENDKLNFQIQTLDERLEKIAAVEKEHKKELDELKKKKEKFENVVIELNNYLNKDSENAKNLMNLGNKLQQLRKSVLCLELKEGGLKEHATANIAVKKVLENKRVLGRIYGTVANLGKVSSKYSTALDIAAAQRVKSIVVEDDTIAAKCIKFLKKGRFGSATFLPLNKIKQRPIDEKTRRILKEKGVHGFAINLIKYDRKFKNIFSYVFGNTLVIDDIDVSRRIGIGKARMVTLDGDLSELSGAMIGGYRHKRHGYFKQKDLEDDLDRKKEEVLALEKEIASLEKEREKDEKEISNLRQQKYGLEGEIIKSEKSLHLSNEDLESTKVYKKDLLEHIKEVEAKISKQEKILDKKTDELIPLKIKKQEIRNKILQLRNPSVIAELNAFGEKKKELNEGLVKVDTEIRNIELQLTQVLNREKESSEKVIEEMKKEKNNFQNERKELEEQQKNLQKALKEKEKAQQEFFSQYKSLFEKRNRLGNELNDIEIRIFGLEENLRKKEIELNTLSIEETRIITELNSLNSEYSRYEGVELALEKSEEKLKKEISGFEKLIARIGSVNLRALDIYEMAQQEHNKLTQKKDKLSEEKNDVMQMMQEIESSKKELFMNKFEVINENFKAKFQGLSTKGDAYLELENLEKPFEGGLSVKVKLSGNKFLDLRSLSGGEKTLTALAFIFSIQEHEPASFYVLDEVDAALDKHNSEKLAKMIREYSNNAQYLVISHNDAIVSEADALYGVSMNVKTGLSKVFSVKT